MGQATPPADSGLFLWRSGARIKQAPTPMILAQRSLDLFEESGTTPKEQSTALEIVRTIVYWTAFIALFL